MLGLEWRYSIRVSARVDREGRSYYGDTIIQVIRQAGLFGSIGGWFRGTALAVDIGNAGTLFLTLHNEWPMWIAHEVFGPQLGGAKTTDRRQLAQLTRLQGVSAPLPIRNYAEDDPARSGRAPVEYFVKFNDPAVPSSVVQVDPFNLARDFGADTSLRAIRLEITDRLPATDIYRRLPWLHEGGGALLRQPDGVAIGDMPLAGRLTHGDFATGI